MDIGLTYSKSNRIIAVEFMGKQAGVIHETPDHYFVPDWNLTQRFFDEKPRVFSSMQEAMLAMAEKLIGGL